MVNHVLFVHHGENWIRGSERAMLDLAAALPAYGWQVTVVCTADAVVNEARALGIPAERFDPSPRRGLFPRRDELKLWRSVLLDKRPSVVHVNDMHFLPPLIACALYMRVPLLVHQHILADAFSRLYSLMHQASAIVTISREAEAAVANDGYPRSRLHRIPNGVPLRPAASPVNIREIVGADEEDAVAVSVGSLIERKGHDRTLRGLRQALDSGARVRLAIIGSGPERAALAALSDQLGISECVHFLGERTDVQALLQNADYFIAAAHEEVQPLSVIEAMLSGLAVIASDISAHREMVNMEAGGLVVDASDSQAIGNAIVDLAGKRAELQQQRPRVAAHAAEQYSFVRHVERFVQLYQSLAQTPRQEYGFRRGVRRVPAYATWLSAALRRRLIDPDLRWTPTELPRTLTRE